MWCWWHSGHLQGISSISQFLKSFHLNFRGTWGMWLFFRGRYREYTSTDLPPSLWSCSRNINCCPFLYSPDPCRQKKKKKNKSEFKVSCCCNLKFKEMKFSNLSSVYSWFSHFVSRILKRGLEGGFPNQLQPKSSSAVKAVVSSDP